MTSLVFPAAIPFAVPTSRWDDAHAAALNPQELLLYRSNLLGSDLTVTNFGGGNTSAKLTGTDPLSGEAVEVLWVKGIKPNCWGLGCIMPGRMMTTRWSAICRIARST